MSGPSTHTLGDDDDMRGVICVVVCDGHSWRATGTWIDRAQGPVVILQLAPPTSSAVIEHEPAPGARLS